jgi:Protein of unknown function (DUF3007)
MNVMKGPKMLAWVFLYTVAVDLLSQSFGGSTTTHHARNTILLPIAPNVVRGVSAFIVSSSLSSSCLIQKQQSHLAQFPSPKRISRLASSNDDENGSDSTSNTSRSSLPFYLDPNTKGGVVVLTFVLFLGTYITDQIFINVLNYDEIDAGITIGMGFTVLSTLAWMSTYLFRVATKDMTYVSLLWLFVCLLCVMFQPLSPKNNTHHPCAFVCSPRTFIFFLLPFGCKK